jgi:hypothetical protein
MLAVPLGVLIFRLNNGLEKEVKVQYKYMVVFLVLNFVWIGLTWAVGYPQLAAIPPILVVVYESLQKPMYNGKIAFKQSLTLTLSATVGTLLYFALDLWILVTLIDMILMYILLRIVGVRIPAVYAFPLLPFIFPDRGPTNKTRKTYAKQISTWIKPIFPTLRNHRLYFIG